MIKFTKLSCILLIAGIGVANDGYAGESDPGAWVTASLSGPLPVDATDTNWRYTIDAQMRYLDTDQSVTQWVLRPSVGLQLSDSLEARVGYARFENDRQGARSTHEDRLWQQLNWTAGRWQDGTVSIRTRLEQRSVSSGDDLGLVLRVMARYVRPYGDSGDRYFTAAIEPFVDFRDTDWGAQSGLHQNRIYFGFGRRLNARTTVELGYMNQALFRDNAPDRMNHLAMVSFSFRP